jgi:hypothetical protein
MFHPRNTLFEEKGKETKKETRKKRNKNKQIKF